MEDKDLQNIWKKLDSEIEYKSKEDLNQILNSKANKTINKFLYHLIFSLLASLGFTTFLVITTINRWDDPIYRLNNLIIGSYTTFVSIGLIWSIFKLKNNRSNLSLKEWLEQQIKNLSGWIYDKTVYYIIPFIFILVFISIHVYYEHKTFIEVFRGEDFYGVSLGLIIGLIVSFVGVFKFKKRHHINLEYLKNLYKIICDSNLFGH